MFTFLAFILLIFSVLGIASNAIGVQCASKSDTTKSNKGFLIFMLSFSVLTAVLAFVKLIQKARAVGVAGVASAIANPMAPVAR
jgi:hypothetical protein